MLPRKIFESLHTVGAILVLFEQSLGKFCLKFLPLILSVAPYMMHVVRTGRLHFRLCMLGVRFIVIEKIRNYGKVVFIKNMFENGW